ncbi:hypothetical protein HWV62_45729 [Athelia sp. TMB]|nr:hypothetical protein HWV62_45729 [Athelia sp. TMB]
MVWLIHVLLSESVDILLDEAVPWKLAPIGNHPDWRVIKNSAKVTWQADVYIYCTNASPEDTAYWKSNGEIKVVVIHRGRTTHSGLGADLKSIKFKTVLRHGRLQLPDATPPYIRGSNSQYSISFQQDMAMAGGTHPARYEHSFVRSGTKQTGEVYNDYTEFSILPNSEVQHLFPVRFHLLIVVFSGANARV